jgi:hypothetical protein
MAKLSFDGKGINNKSKEYSPRIATFVDDQAAQEFGPLFEAAPEVLAYLKGLVHYFDGLEGPYSDHKKDILDLIAKAEGK